ncbi:hypothetical protein HRG_002916 [Hirsutella rhossiliensis]|uniref:Uncharacterized protein n=1 Tax=Hirsutella rhossiliensis TaxID=111463 RepID=A0A9P8N0Z4_9HYPO|nr:uncharacterized protein HRG_02916 [Hirsutella rhossiliensis]KAH0964900.1 hypothetical protein HRG_02916 [Hirsutella rhossiliensis]
MLDSMGVSTLSSAGKAVPYMRMTDRAVPCQEPIMAADFAECRIPGGVDLWTRNGFYSPGVCFVGYMAHCTQTVGPSDGWPLRDGETAVRCIPEDYDCNAPDKDQRLFSHDSSNNNNTDPGSSRKHDMDRGIHSGSLRDSSPRAGTPVEEQERSDGTQWFWNRWQ